MRLPLLTISLLIVVLASAAVPVDAEALNGVQILKGQWKGQEIEYLDGEILIGLRSGRSQAELSSQISALPVSIVRPADRFGFLKIKVAAGHDLFRTIREIAKLPSVRYAEPNMVDRLLVIPNDPRFNEQWHYHNIGQNPPGGTVDADIDAPEGWNISTGDDTIIVGILDSGIPMQNGQLSHPDLDDPNKIILGGNMISPGQPPADDNGHGTHVAGTIGAESNNGIGVAGVAWNARLMPIKVFDASGSGSHEYFRDGCIYAVDHGCKVINYSGGGTPSATKEHGVAYADSNNVVICAAAGNNYQGSVDYPGAYAATYNNLICVSATDHNDASSPFSSIGPEVTISAPGGFGSPFDANDVISTFPNYSCYLSTTYGLPLNYGPLAGTSMATPHVAGFAALILGVNPSLTPDSVRKIMINTADDLGPAGRDNQFGWGRINVYNALSLIGGVDISHTPLGDTRDSVNSYEVICGINSTTALIADSALLYFRVDSAAWQKDTLLLISGTQYHGYIPPQHPGHVIDYYLYARNVDGKADTTSTFTFRVIDYALAVRPPVQNLTGATGDTLWYALRVINQGVYTDNYSLSALGGVWPSSLWNESATLVLSSTGPLGMDDSLAFKVRVIVPASFYGDVDSLMVQATSTGQPLLSATAQLVTTSQGAPLALPFLENFPTGTADVGKWVKQVNIEVNALGTNEPTAPYSLNLDGNPTGADTLMTQALNLQGQSNVVLRYAYEQTGGGEPPDAGDDLWVEYLDSLGVWNLLQRHYGTDPDMSSYQAVELTLPGAAYHKNFRLRLRNIGTVGNYDDWFVDDIFVGLPSDFAVAAQPSFQAQYGPAGDSAVYGLYVRNQGLYPDNYTLLDSGNSWPVVFFDSSGTTPLSATGSLAPTDSVKVLVKVAIPPATPVHAGDTAALYVVSQGDPGVATYTVIATYSAGTPAAMPWSEPVPTAGLDAQKWFANVGAEVTTQGANPPSPPYMLNLDGGRDTLVTQLIDLSGQSEARVSYFYERGGPGDLPETGDNLWVEYKNNLGVWTSLQTHLGGDTALHRFAFVNLPLPPDAAHPAFQLRLRSSGGGVGQDDWFVDDIRIDLTPALSVTPAALSRSLQQGDSTTAALILSNAGPGGLAYYLTVQQFVNAFKRLRETGQVQPGSFGYPQEYYTLELPKGATDLRVGEEVKFNGGGPDNFGYHWLDSDEPGGPSYNWIDVSGSGTDVIGGLDDDNYIGPLPLGFTFPFYGNHYTSLYIGANGIIGFGAAGMNAYQETPLPNVALPNALLAWLWDDLDPDDPDNPGAHVYLDTTGDRCVIQFKNYPEFQAQAGDVINAEVILYASGTIKLQYQAVGAGFDILSATVGLENAAGDDGLTVAYHTAYVHNTLALQIFQPYSWLVPGVLTGEVPAGGADTVLCRLVTTGLDTGSYSGELEISSTDPDDNPWTVPAQLQVTAYACGNANANGGVNVADAVYIINYVFVPGSPAPNPYAAGNVNCDVSVNVADAVYIINYVFVPGSPAPCAGCK